jgi:sigma-B regulation protein RsbU (phosphoserine phosphatase)
MSDSTVEAVASGARLLVVDDNEDNRYTLILRLEIEGYQDITTADDGQAALELLRTQPFDLVLLDVMMPNVDGYGVLEQLRAEGRLHNIPVIMISALNELDSVVRCIELGAVDYLSKPFDPVLLKARVGASLEKKRLRDAVRAHLARIEEELEAARQLQLSMVPSVFPPPTARLPLEIFGMMEPAREVGGDLYDFYQADDGTLNFLIGDVSGKGVASALFMARAKNGMRLVTRLFRRADGSAPSPAEVVATVNRELCRDNPEMMFVTLFFGRFDPRTRALRFTNAGHNPPYLLAGDVATPITAAKGRPLGVRADSTFETGELVLGPDEAIYLYTDGVTEAANKKDELFTEARLEAVLRETAGRPIKAIVDAVTDAVRSFADGAPQSDDITALAIRRVDV